MRRWRAFVAAVVAVLVLVALPAEVRAQNLLLNGSLEMPTGNRAGRDTVPPGWALDEGPLVPEEPGPYEGDYNDGGIGGVPCPAYGCGAVDAADYVVWRDRLGQNVEMPNRSPLLEGFPIVDFDYDVWAEHYGEPPVMSLAEPTDFLHLLFDGDWYMWFQPYNGSFAEAEDNFAHLTQSVAGTPGMTYTLKGWALFEEHYAGGRTHLNLPGSSETPPDDGPLSPTDSFFALEFLDAGGSVLQGSVEIELMADGQTNSIEGNPVWMEHTLNAVAPASTAQVRVRISMIDGVLNEDVDPQSFLVDLFSLTAAAGSGAGNVVPEPLSFVLVVISLTWWMSLRYRSKLDLA